LERLSVSRPHTALPRCVHSTALSPNTVHVITLHPSNFGLEILAAGFTIVLVYLEFNFVVEYMLEKLAGAKYVQVQSRVRTAVVSNVLACSWSKIPTGASG
jgi:hypothetical protein